VDKERPGVRAGALAKPCNKTVLFFCDGEVFFLDRGLLMGAPLNAVDALIQPGSPVFFLRKLKADNYDLPKVARALASFRIANQGCAKNVVCWR